MTFHQDMRRLVLGHGAINNAYLTRFRAGNVSDREFREFAIEFYNFARFFPRILELTKVLYSELGDGQSRHRHELLYRDFLRSAGVDIHDAMTRPMLPSTRSYIEGMERLYSDGNHTRALGASFGLENMAITMWDHLIPGLTQLKNTRYPQMDITYFTFHRELESSHEEAMEHAVEAVQGAAQAGLSDGDKEDFRTGVTAVLDYLEGFWMGLERQTFPDTARHPTYHHAA